MAAASISVLLLTLAMAVAEAGWVNQRHEESFLSAAYCDKSNTTAWWDTILGELKLYRGACVSAGSYLTPGGAHDIELSGNYAFVADQMSGMAVLNISDPTSPSLLTSTTETGNYHAVTVSGNHAYVADYGYGLRIYDITVPFAPTLVGSAPAGTNTECVTVSGDYAFVGVHFSGMKVYNIVNPASPVFAGSYVGDGYFEKIVVSGDYAFIATNRNSLGFLVLDISDPTHPTHAGHCLTPHYPMGVAVAGDNAYIADGNTGIVVFNVSDPENPVPIDTLDTPGYAYDVEVSGDFAYVADWIDGGLTVIDISNPANAVLVGSCDTPDGAFKVIVSNCYAFVADFASGVQVFKICDLVEPELVDVMDTPGEAHDVAVDGNLAFVADMSGGLRILNIANPADVQPLGNIAMSSAEELAAFGDYVFVADGSSGLRIVDVSDPSNPIIVGTCDTPDLAYGVAVVLDYAYVADYNNGLIVVSTTNPSAPTIIGQCNTPGLAQAVYVDGKHAFVADGEYGLQVIDISNPAAPVIIGTYDTPHHAFDVKVDGDIAYVADSQGGLQIVDVSNPANPTFIASHATSYWARAIDIVLDYVLVADMAGTVLIFNVIDPSNPVLEKTAVVPDDAFGVMVDGFYAFVACRDAGLGSVKIFDRSIDAIHNVAQSLRLNLLDEAIYAVRLNATQSDSVKWEISTNGGVNWAEIMNGAGFSNLSAPGTDLRWRSTLCYLGASDGPVCHSVSVDWLGACAVIDSIVDVRADEGGWARLHMTRSGLDAESNETPIAGYNVYRKVEEQALAAMIAEKGSTEIGTMLLASSSVHNGRKEAYPVADATVAMLDGRCYITSDELPAGHWEIVTSFYALQMDQYEALVPTRSDSTAAGVPYATFLVTAHTTTPSVFYVGVPDSGYSVDNLVPLAPTGLHLVYLDILQWNANSENDLAGYRVYAKTSAGAMPDAKAETKNPNCDIKAFIEEGYHFFGVTAFDRHGNESQLQSISWYPTTGSVVPIVSCLEQNHPNPFNPTTRIGFALNSCEHVSLRVFDVSGKLIKVLLDNPMEAGKHFVDWNGTDRFGHSVASGVYFYRLNSSSYTQTKKMVLLR